MRIGRCLTAIDVSTIGSGSDMFGCSVDVIHILDKRCSFKNQCEIVLTLDADLLQEKPCYPGIQSYLEASFDCLSGN